MTLLEAPVEQRNSKTKLSVEIASVIYTPLSWSSDLKLGLQQFDDDHKTLVQMLNNIFLGFCSNLEDHILKGACSDLLDFTNDHFLREELAMERHPFPELDEHKSEHKGLIDTLSSRMKTLVATRDANTWQSSQDELGSWLSDHIMVHDKKAADFILEQQSFSLA